MDDGRRDELFHHGYEQNIWKKGHGKNASGNCSCYTQQNSLTSVQPRVTGKMPCQ